MLFLLNDDLSVVYQLKTMFFKIHLNSTRLLKYQPRHKINELIGEHR